MEIMKRDNLVEGGFQASRFYGKWKRFISKSTFNSSFHLRNITAIGLLHSTMGSE